MLVFTNKIVFSLTLLREYCDKHARLSVSLSVCLYMIISQKLHSTFKFCHIFVHVLCGHVSVILC